MLHPGFSNGRPEGSKTTREGRIPRRLAAPSGRRVLGEAVTRSQTFFRPCWSKIQREEVAPAFYPIGLRPARKKDRHTRRVPSGHHPLMRPSACRLVSGVAVTREGNTSTRVQRLGEFGLQRGPLSVAELHAPFGLPESAALAGTGCNAYHPSTQFCPLVLPDGEMQLGLFVTAKLLPFALPPAPTLRQSPPATTQTPDSRASHRPNRSAQLPRGIFGRQRRFPDGVIVARIRSPSLLPPE